MSTITAPSTTTTALVDFWRDATIEACLAHVADGSTALAALTDIRSRDCLLWLALTGEARFTLDDLRELGQSAFAFATRGPGAFVAAPAVTAVALEAWMSGADDDAAQLLFSALLFEPGYRLAELLQTAMTAGMSASAFTESVTSLTYDQTRYGTV